MYLMICVEQKPEWTLRIIHVYFNFTVDQASKVYLCIHECVL